MVMMAPVSPAAFSTASLSRGLMVAMSSTRTPIPCSFRMAAASSAFFSRMPETIIVMSLPLSTTVLALPHSNL